MLRDYHVGEFKRKWETMVDDFRFQTTNGLEKCMKNVICGPMPV